MASQIITATAKSLTIKLVTGKIKEMKAPKTWSQFMDIMSVIKTDKDCKVVADIYRSNLTDDQYMTLRKGFFPTVADKKAQGKRAKAAKQRMAKEESKVEAMQAWQSSHPGFLGNGVSRNDVLGSAPSEIRSIYGI